ncbi:LysR family transcriptional regulator [Paracoccus lutimaris]|uniref:LysR family transcriptional regulator n=1 Tax=Paracoccus lutimaris TaxID=1490030 RepID=A0A368YHH2_9RHOB|nr:LysR family transcriptional regulator [Paracoccus lutimaris]RCW79680.1 LysR family transcriptional regulator [Paracoccus lutimaris]
MRLNMWTEIRTAAQVARLGRVSAAAEALGMHHSSVIRHIDLLEERMHTKLFQRHARGYTPTEAGAELLRTASRVDEQFVQMLGRIEAADQQVSGQLIVTALPSLERYVLPAIGRFQAEHPQLRVHYRSDERPYEMASGEAHVALRVGPRPDHPDYVVAHLADLRAGLFAATAYLERHGRPASIEDLVAHRLVGAEGDYARAPFQQWLLDRLPEGCFVLHTPQPSVAYWAVAHGLGIGFLNRAVPDPDLIELFPDFSPPEWISPVWLVTHVDLHRSNKVGGFARFLQNEAKGWRGAIQP